MAHSYHPQKRTVPAQPQPEPRKPFDPKAAAKVLRLIGAGTLADDVATKFGLPDARHQVADDLRPRI